MAKIKLIDGYERIAAGEVIERPASVVKELIENSLDAKSDQIFITIKNAGKDLIEVIDNGAGIDEDELYFAFKSHTSSKIYSADDLEKIYTLGFRGEALASISAISQLEIISRPKNQEYGMQLVLKAGEKIKKEQCGAPIGTKISIKNIFYNLPVRRKFLKSDRVEIGHISDIICRYSLAYPLVHFKLVHNSLTLISSPKWVINSPNKKKNKKSNNKENFGKLEIEAYKYAIQTIYGKKIVNQMIPISFTDEKMKIWGYFGKPGVARSERSAASLFVNERLVSNKAITKIMQNAYKDYLMRHKYPFYVLFINLPSENVDFNVHPTKKIVKFLDEHKFLNELDHILSKLVKSHFKKDHALFNKGNSTYAKTTDTAMDYWTPTNKRPLKTDPSKKSLFVKKNTTTIKTLPGIKIKSKPKPKQTHFKIYDKRGNSKNLSKKSHLSQSLDLAEVKTSQLPNMKLLNSGIQAGKNYLIFQNEEGLIIFDQHADHERINYEKTQKIFAKEKLSIQQLIVPIKLDVSQNEIEFVKESITEMKKFGFDIEFFGGGTFILRTIPSILKLNQISESLIRDMCLGIIQMGKNQNLSEIKREIIQYIGCHQSIRAGDEIWSRKRIKRLIHELDQCENPHHCAHGRPVYIKIAYDELDKWFHRTG